MLYVLVVIYTKVYWSICSSQVGNNLVPSVDALDFFNISARLVERKKAAVKRCEEQLLNYEVQATDREENKQIALGTSKLNYLDPRISVAWWVIVIQTWTH